MEGFRTISGQLTGDFLDVIVAESFTGREVTWSEIEKR
jgi:hypothetical protein